MNAAKKNKVVYVLDEKAGTYQAWDYETLVHSRADTGGSPVYKVRKVDGEYVVFSRNLCSEQHVTPESWHKTEEEAYDAMFELNEQTFNNLVNNGFLVFTHTEAEAKARLDWLGYK